MLVGRQHEQELIGRLLLRACEGQAGTIVLRGEPGAGKTALLRDAVDRAAGMSVVRATGIESDAELEFSGLLEVCRPLLGRVEALPGPQADALRIALGIASGPAPDRFAVGAATLGLLADAAEHQPVLVAVDDAQWLDDVSADALVFAARRLLADSVAFLFAARESGFEHRGLEELPVRGLDVASAAEVLGTSAGAPVERAVVEALHRSTGGNPLALLELPRHLSEAQLAGAEPLEGPLPVTAEIERAFAGRLLGVPEDTRRALCVLAAWGGDDDVAVPLRALASLGLGADALMPAEDADLAVLEGGRFSFRHPLLRSVAYHERPPTERRTAHAALAAALDGSRDAERRAWHLAAAAVGLDDAAADALADAAVAARARGGQAAAAAALERAARLTSDPLRRLEWVAAAAQAAWELGDAVRAATHVDEVLAGDPDPELRARVLGLSGRIEFQAGSLERACELLLETAAALLELGKRTEAVTFMGVATLTIHNLARIDDAVELGRRAVAVAESESEDVRMRAAYHLGRALQIAGRTREAEPLLEAAIANLLEPAEPSRFALQRAAIALAVLDRTETALPLARRTLEAAHAAGPAQVVYALTLVAQLEIHGGDWRSAVARANEGTSLARDIGLDNIAATFASFLVRVAGMRGDEAAFSDVEPVARSAVLSSGNRFERLQLDHAAGVLALARDRLDEAVAVLGRTADEVESLRLLDRDLAPEADLVEALVRIGSDDDARLRLERWVSRGVEGAGRWGPPLASRCRALTRPDGFEVELDHALDRHAVTGDRYAEARTRLVYGERLRRAGRRVDARDQLRTALAIFERLDAEAWAERARRELRASGEKLRRQAGAGDELTPQELQIALQVAEGKQNKEVAAALFLSPKTVEFHLSRVYRKLDVASRSELVRRFAVPA